MQSKKEIRLGFADYYHPIDEFFVETLSKRFEVIRDDVNPEYLIFCDETFGNSNLTYDPSVKKIFFTGENRRPYNYGCNFAISFDFINHPNHYRLPLYVIENWVQMTKLGMSDNLVSNFREYDSFSGKEFCTFVASNGICAERNNMFMRLNQYKPVLSGGPLFNNIGRVLLRDGFNAQKEKFWFLYGAKFNLCYENSSHHGYVTEKLFHALCAGVVPIYWGSPSASLDFNQDAFISRHQFNSDDEMIEYIKYVDSNDDVYSDMLVSPILSSLNSCYDTNLFLDWFEERIVG